MFVSESLVFTELHKTAGSHLLKLLSTYVGGQQIGKHNRIPEDLRNKFVLGSIRNPWDWYVSLWGYGCDRQGSVYLQTTRKSSLRYCLQQLPKEMGRQRPAVGHVAKQMKSDLNKDNQAWQAVYADSADVQAFRRWVRMMFDPAKAMDIGEGYGFSPFSQHAGLLSYRFFKLFTALDERVYDKSLDTSFEKLKLIWNEQGFVNAFVRQENLEDDFISSVAQAGISLSDSDKASILDGKNKKTNTSSRKAVSHYYDEETANIILQREKFIIERFGYDVNAVLR